MSTSSTVTEQQVVTNFQNTFYCNWDVNKYHKGLEAVQTLWNKGTATAQASFTAALNQLNISAAVEGDSYVASVTNIHNPAGGTSSGDVAMSGSLQGLVNDTKSIYYSNGSILAIYFLDKDDSVIAVYGGGAISGMNPDKGSAAGFWT